MDTSTFSHKELLQTLDIAVALVRAADWQVIFENAKFFKWFPSTADDDEMLHHRIEGLNTERAAGRVENGRRYSFETKSDLDGREEPIRVSVESFAGQDEPTYLIQCVSISKEMETQYMLDSYSRISEKNARELEKEKERVERLLLNIMPRAVFEEMKEYGTATPQRFDNITILMLDFVGFTNMTISQDPSAIIAELNDIFSSFDRIT